MESKNISIREAFINCVDEKFVDTTKESLTQAQTATFQSNINIKAIISPKDKEEVIKCLEVANKLKCPLYPISKGKNWGYGSRVPPQNDSVLLSLERLNKITDYNEQLAYITLEPGVTFKQLNEFLRSHNSNLMLSAPGTSEEASVIGNLLERGIVQGIYADRSNFFSSLEVILPDGSILNTGLNSFQGAKSSVVHKWGIGPSLDNLFIQSNLGIIISATTWLVPMPKFHQQFHFKVTHNNSFSKAINQLQYLKINGTLRASCSMFNDYRLLTMMQKFPFNKTTETPLNNVLKKEMMGELGEGWFLLSAIDGQSELELEAKRSIIVSYFNQLNIKIAFEEINADHSIFSFELKSGLSSVYWRKKSLPNQQIIDPDKDKCGVIFAGFIVPFCGDNILESSDLIKTIMLNNSFEPAISIQAITERCVCVLSSILFDRENSNEDEKAWACYISLLEEMAKIGYYPYRLTSSSMNLIPRRLGEYESFLKKIKKLFDPNLILAPGRYI